MLFTHAESINKRKGSDLIVLPFWQRGKKNKQTLKAAALFNLFESQIQPAIDSGDFNGGASETLLLYTQSGKEPQILLLGLGREEEITVEVLRKAFSNVTKECQKKAITSLNLVVPTVSELRKINVEECVKGICEGLLLTNYRWEKLASVDEETVLLKSVCLIGIIPKMLEIATSRFEKSPRKMQAP